MMKLLQFGRKNPKKWGFSTNYLHNVRLFDLKSGEFHKRVTNIILYDEITSILQKTQKWGFSSNYLPWFNIIITLFREILYGIYFNIR